MFLASKYIVMIFLITLEICLGILLGQDFNKLIVPWKGFPDGSVIKNLPAKAGDVGLITEAGRSPVEGNGSPLQYSCLENPMDRGAWLAIVHKVARAGHDLGTKQQQQ